MTLETIKEAIEQLPDAELRQLLAWLDEHEQLAWDAEMERDFAPEGHGSSLVEKVKSDRPRWQIQADEQSPFVSFSLQPSEEFWRLYHCLPADIQRQADKRLALFRDNPSHPSRLKQVGPFWTVNSLLT